MSKATPEQERIDQIHSQGTATFIKWVDGYKNGESKCLLLCKKCSHEWPVRVSSFVNHANGCPKCKGVYCYTPKEYEDRVNGLSGINFIGWVNEKRSAMSRVFVSCTHGHQWDASLNCLLSLGSGCPKCHPRHNVKPEDYIKRINEIDGVSFIRWTADFSGKRTRAVFKCKENHEWETIVGNLLTGEKSRCPTCADHGYSVGRPGHLYALVSDCGNFIKIGISNNHKIRIKRLIKYTPFPFFTLKTWKSKDGMLVKKSESAIHHRFESAKLSGFQGCTEWLKNTEELRDYLASFEL